MVVLAEVSEFTQSPATGAPLPVGPAEEILA
jgi:hypothetical protein